MMSKKPKDRKQKTLKKIREREEDRLGSSSVVYTNAFSARQTFGSASEVRQINPKELSPEELQRLVSL
jgi:hypothetical protein